MGRWGRIRKERLFARGIILVWTELRIFKFHAFVKSVIKKFSTNIIWVKSIPKQGSLLRTGDRKLEFTRLFIFLAELLLRPEDEVFVREYYIVHRRWVIPGKVGMFPQLLAVFLI